MTTFLTVSDRMFFPGTLAAVNSILRFHQNARIVVTSGSDYNARLTKHQSEMLVKAGVEVNDYEDYRKEGRVMGAWQMKAYSAEKHLKESDVLVGFDSDLVLCGSVDHIIESTKNDGKFRGGRDGDGVNYGDSYKPYGFPIPASNKNYTSTSLYFIKNTPDLVALTEEWAECCNKAHFGPQKEKLYDGYSDQGVLNALLWKHKIPLEQLNNRTVSQHWTYWSDVVAYDAVLRSLVNVSQKRSVMVSIHCGGTDKFWAKSHSDKVKTTQTSQLWSYVWFLYNMWFGKASDRTIDPCLYLANESHHLAQDLLFFAPMLMEIGSDVRLAWQSIGPKVYERMLQGTHRMMSLGGSMTKYQEIARRASAVGDIVEVGSYHGGSAIALAASLSDTVRTVYSVESFTGNLDNTVDGYKLPSMADYAEQTKKRFPWLRIISIPLPSNMADELFVNHSCGMVFIDGNHSYDAVMQDIKTWLPKVAKGGVIGGDDYGFDGVKRAVIDTFGSVNNESGIWWVDL